MIMKWNGIESNLYSKYKNRSKGSQTTDLSSFFYLNFRNIFPTLEFNLPQLSLSLSLKVGLKQVAVAMTNPTTSIFANTLSKAVSYNPLKQMCSMTLLSNYLPILTIILFL